MPSLLNLYVLCLAVALSTTKVLAHPLFNGQLISRAGDLFPEYDYVVVGAGAAGLTVANRISEQAGRYLAYTYYTARPLTSIIGRSQCPHN